VFDPIALAVPFFFVLIAIELIWARRRGVRVYRFNDAVTDLSCGITSQLVLLAYATVLLAIYSAVYARFRIVTWERAWVPWLLAFLGVDFLYYWWHRLSHEVNLLWAAHVVHHQSEDYNLAVALRQAVLTSWTALPFYLPLAVIGVPTHVYALVHAASTLYQFWIHTELFGKVTGPVDWILNLPSHHRVHHAVNEAYLDKNYGATLIVWDRLFGTYIEETEKPIYGLTKPLGTFDPMWAQVHYWFEMAHMARAARGAREKMRVLFASPAWKPAALAAAPATLLGSRKKFDRPLSRRLAAYVGVQYAVVVSVSFVLLMWHHTLPTALVLGGALAVLSSLVGFGALLDGRGWARRFEAARLVLSGAILVALVASGCKRRPEDPKVEPADGPSAVLPALERGSSPAPALRSERRSLMVAGQTRTFLLLAPQAEPQAREPEAAPRALVLVFHGDGGTAQSFHAGFPFERGSGHDAILAYLDGLRTTWDLESPKESNHDIAFAKAVIDSVSSERPVDRSRIFAVGYSSGGFFANVLGCHEPGLLRAISSSAGGAPYKLPSTWPNGYPKCPGQQPLAVIALHGQRDASVTIDSGRFSAAYWAYVNGCDTRTMETTGYGECTAYRGCPSGKAVAWCDVPRLDHWVWEKAAVASWSFFETTSARP
jgi:sterol desaturase/sphingolipid hydroxylase (fatty acid hydroxylase superfamily)/poly(3-hydroxybutyrate) depolymerase